MKRYQLLGLMLILLLIVGCFTTAEARKKVAEETKEVIVVVGTIVAPLTGPWAIAVKTGVGLLGLLIEVAILAIPLKGE